MSSQVKSLLIFVILVVISANNLSLAQMNCAKIDFNRTTFPEFGVCLGKNQPNFVINDYLVQKEITPFRQNTKYYLSNNFHDTYSCAESTIPLTVTSTTLIEMAVNLRSAGASFLEIVIYDADRKERIDSLRTDGTSGWQIIHKNLYKTIAHARIEISGFIQEKSVLGIEYINLVDTSIKTPECKPTNHDYVDQSLPTWAWILIGFAVIILIILAISIGYYFCIYDKRRNNIKIGGTNK